MSGGIANAANLWLVEPQRLIILFAISMVMTLFKVL
jgi:hypothetical protein